MQKQSPADLWLRARERKHKEREALRLEVLDQVDQTLGGLVEKYRWTECYLFGSILLPGLAKHDLYRLIAEVSSILERDVDVVVLEESRFPESIRQKGKLWSPRKP